MHWRKLFILYRNIERKTSIKKGCYHIRNTASSHQSIPLYSNLLKVTICWELFMQTILINSNELGILNLLSIKVLQQDGTRHLSNVVFIVSFSLTWELHDWGKLTNIHRQDKNTWFRVCANYKKSLEADLTWIVSSPSHQESEVEPL